MKYVKIVLSDTVHQMLKIKCATEGVTMSSKIDELIKEYIEFDKLEEGE